MKRRSATLTGTLAIAVIAVAGAVLGACGVEGERTFRPVRPSDIPFGLGVGTSVPATTTTSTTIPQPTTTIPRSTTTSTTIATVPVTLYFVRNDGKLVSITRQRPKPVDLTQVLKELGDGPVFSDSPHGLRTVVKPEHVRSVKKALSGVAEVVVTQAFIDLGSQQQQLAIAQLVYTFTEEGGVGQVSFIDPAGAALPVPTLKGDGVLKNPVSQADFPSAVAT